MQYSPRIVHSKCVAITISGSGSPCIQMLYAYIHTYIRYCVLCKEHNMHSNNCDSNVDTILSLITNSRCKHWNTETWFSPEWKISVVVFLFFFVSHKLPRRGLESGERACGCCRVSVRSRRLSTHRKAPSCRQLSCRASVDVISGPISPPPIGRPGVTRLLFLLWHTVSSSTSL